MNDSEHEAPAAVVGRMLHSVTATAELTSLSPSTIRRMIKAGKLRPTRIGDRVLISTEAIDAMIREAS